MNHRKLVIAIAFIVIVLAAGAIWYRWPKPSEQGVWLDYTQHEYGIELRFPYGWHIVDNLTPKTCCLFIVAYDISTSTSMKNGTTSDTITATERIKLQIGPYDIKTYDPFRAASTTKERIGESDFYVGTYNGTPFYILPRSRTEGIGVALFTYPNTPDSAKKTARDIISTITLVATSTASSTEPTYY